MIKFVGINIEKNKQVNCPNKTLRPGVLSFHKNVLCKVRTVHRKLYSLKVDYPGKTCCAKFSFKTIILMFQVHNVFV